MKALLFLLTIITITSCQAFMYGYTKSDSFNTYHLVTADKKSFGNKRLSYNLFYHSETDLSCHIANQGYPDFIYEFRDDKKRDGIQLYYTKMDSVFEFTEQKRNDGRSTKLTARRIITDDEKMEYQALRSGQSTDSLVNLFNK